MKIIASDYDGTLNYGGIDDKKRNAINLWRENGNLFGLVSGRGLCDLTIIPVCDGFECDFLLACNGAVIAKPDGTVLKESRCDGSLTKPLIEFLFESGCKRANIETASQRIVICVDEKHPDCDYPADNIPDTAYFNQISTVTPDDKSAAVVTAAIKERFGEYLNPLQNGSCIDIVAADMNKARGLYDFLELTGASYDDMITVGDNINDTHMIKEFRSYAMANAVDSIKAIADYETKGITELIERELKN